MIYSMAAMADSIDMDDPRRTLGRENDVRVDAQLILETVSPGSPVGVVYQIQNLRDLPVAVADKVADASYDSDSRTITVAIGSEVPADGIMPRLILIAPGEKKVFRAGATPAINTAAIRGALENAPRFVQVKVSILSDLTPFSALIGKQSGAPQRLSDELFDRWFESTDTIYLNAVPVRWQPRTKLGSDAERRGMSGSF
jgi:hypothetical protein